MKITIEHGKKRYEVVPCDPKKCSFCKTGGELCGLPNWFYKLHIEEDGADDCKWSGLREIHGNREAK